jgi:hypothetical protein
LTNYNISHKPRESVPKMTQEIPTTKYNKLLISAKSGSEWSKNELNFFRIGFEVISNFKDFFDTETPEKFPEYISKLIEYDMSDIININYDNIESENIREFIKYLISATKTHINEESAVDDFARHILLAFKYNKGDNIVRVRQELSLRMFGQNLSAKPDICVENVKSTIKLLVQEDKSYNASKGTRLDIKTTEAQMVAEAIAAFQNNNRIRTAFNEPELDSYCFPCIAMLGTYPIFYLFNVTKNLAESVEEGKIPTNITIIKKFQIPIKTLMIGDIFYNKESRKQIFQCYQALRKWI